MNNTKIEEVKFLSLDELSDSKGVLVVLQDDKTFLSQFKRTFIVSADKGTTRGDHSHLLCSQLMVCLIGEVEVLCDDSKNKRSYILRQNDSLHIPPGIWSSQVYKGAVNLLAVWCDRAYEEEDYLRDYNQFLESKSIL